MNTFDVVMEKAYDQDMENKMKASYERGKNAYNSDNIKNARKLLTEARKLAKSGNTKEAKKKYQECLKNISAAGTELNNAWRDLNNSGEGKKRLIQILGSLVLSFIGIFAFAGYGIAKVYNSSFTNNTMGIVKGGTIGIGGELASGIAGKLYQKYVTKDDKPNYKKFASMYKENPEKVLRMVAKDIDTLYDMVNAEMKSLKA